MPIFLDTGFFIGLYNSQDNHHERCLYLVEQLKNGLHGRIFSSIFVLNELLTYIQRKVNHQESSRIAQDWFENGKNVGELIQFDDKIVSKASKLFIEQSYQRKPLSFTDCLIIESCKFVHISKIITFDGEFKQYLDVIQ